MTAGDHIFPDGFATLNSWDHMINVQFLLGQFSGAVLTSVLIPNEHLASRKANMLRRATIEVIQKHYLWNRNGPVNGAYQMKLIKLLQRKGC